MTSNLNCSQTDNDYRYENCIVTRRSDEDSDSGDSFFVNYSNPVASTSSAFCPINNNFNTSTSSSYCGEPNPVEDPDVERVTLEHVSNLHLNAQDTFDFAMGIFCLLQKRIETLPPSSHNDWMLNKLMLGKTVLKNSEVFQQSSSKPKAKKKAKSKRAVPTKSKSIKKHTEKSQAADKSHNTDSNNVEDPQVAGLNETLGNSNNLKRRSARLECLLKDNEVVYCDRSLYKFYQTGLVSYENLVKSSVKDKKKALKFSTVGARPNGFVKVKPKNKNQIKKSRYGSRLLNQSETKGQTKTKINQSVGSISKSRKSGQTTPKVESNGVQNKKSNISMIQNRKPKKVGELKGSEVEIKTKQKQQNDNSVKTKITRKSQGEKALETLEKSQVRKSRRSDVSDQKTTMKKENPMKRRRAASVSGGIQKKAKLNTTAGSSNTWAFRSLPVPGPTRKLYAPDTWLNHLHKVGLDY